MSHRAADKIPLDCHWQRCVAPCAAVSAPCTCMRWAAVLACMPAPSQPLTPSQLPFRAFQPLCSIAPPSLPPSP